MSSAVRNMVRNKFRRAKRTARYGGTCRHYNEWCHTTGPVIQCKRCRVSVPNYTIR